MRRSRILSGATITQSSQYRDTSRISRFLEYLEKLRQIVVLDESDRYVRVFIPGEQATADFRTLWQNFLTDVAFSANGDTKHQLPGLVQTNKYQEPERLCDAGSSAFAHSENER